MRLLVWVPLFCLLASPVSLAQDDDDPSWYTVELIVFRFLEPDLREGFDLLPQLHYPEHIRILEPGPQAWSLEDSFELQRPEDLLPTPAFSLDLTPGEPETQPSAATEPPANEALPDDLVQPDYTVPAAFTPLPAEALEFEEQRQRMARSRDLRVLFHQRWHQQLLPENSAQSMLVESEEGVEHPVLQGTIRLHISRYLHLETNLWLNLVREDLPTGWAMPAPPLAPAPIELSDYRFEVDVEMIQPLGRQPVQLLSLADALLAPIEIRDLPARLDADGQPIPVFVEAGFLAQRDYFPYNHAVLLQQKRRMRSGEVHYIDHPYLGIIIKLTPYEFSPILPEAALTEVR